MAGNIIYIIALELASILVVYPKGAGQMYLDMMLILLGITFLSWVLVRKRKCNGKIVLYTMVLVTIGIMLQCMFKGEAVLQHPELKDKNIILSLQIQYIIAFLAAVLFAFWYKRTKWLKKAETPLILFGVSVAVYMLTLILAKAVGNVKNWIVIGGISIQTSEINKLLYVFVLAGLLGARETPSKRRIEAAFYVTAVNACFLILQSELGTLLLMLVLFPVFLFLFIPDLKVTLYTIAGGISGVGIITAICMWFHHLAVSNKTIGALSITKAFLRNYNKVSNRVTYWIHPEKDPLGLGYQLVKAKQAIIRGGWFGTESISNLPVKTSDMVYPALIERCGILIAILVFVLFVLIWLEGIRVFVCKKDKYHQAVGAGMVFMFFDQTLIIIGGSCGMCPLTGITLPFISSGGSSLLTSSIIIATILMISGDVSWKGVIEDEEELEFFKKDTTIAKSVLALCHRNGSGTD